MYSAKCLRRYFPVLFGIILRLLTKACSGLEILPNLTQEVPSFDVVKVDSRIKKQFRSSEKIIRQYTLLRGTDYAETTYWTMLAKLLGRALGNEQSAEKKEIFTILLYVYYDYSIARSTESVLIVGVYFLYS